MCTHLTASINADADRDAVRSTFAPLGFRFEDGVGPPELPPGRRYLVLRSGRCDCCTAVGSGAFSGGPPYGPADLQGLRKQGWSETKIARWARQKSDAAANGERAEADRLRASHGELATWTGLVRAVLGTPTVRVFGLMHDDYARGPGYDVRPVGVEPPRPLETLDEASLFRMPPGVLREWGRAT